MKEPQFFVGYLPALIICLTRPKPPAKGDVFPCIPWLYFDNVGVFWAHIGVLLDNFGASLAHFGNVWAHFGNTNSQKTPIFRQKSMISPKKVIPDPNPGNSYSNTLFPSSLIRQNHWRLRTNLVDESKI